jgi:hypothetical protein
MSIMSEATIACLDTTQPLVITTKSDFFEDLCGAWIDSKTVVDLMQRQTADIARFAWMAAKDQATRAPRPAFHAAVRATRAQPRLTEDIAIGHANTHEMSKLEEVWASIGEQPTVSFDRRPKRFTRLRLAVVATATAAVATIAIGLALVWP